MYGAIVIETVNKHL